jgi:hypothetical protein
MRLDISRTQKLLVAWIIAALVAAGYTRHRPFAEKSETLIGLIEVLLAVLTGFVFGASILKKTRTSAPASIK